MSPGIDPRPTDDYWSLSGPSLPIHYWRPLVAKMPAINGWGLVAAGQPGPDHWLPAVQRPMVADNGSASGQRLAVAC
jgi:hypothetical protein